MTKEVSLNAIKGVFRNGQIVMKEPVDWPEGTELRIEPADEPTSYGLRDEDWPTTPEGIARHLALMDQIQPLEMTPEEEAEWEAARKERKEWDLAHWEEYCKKIERLFE
jgi:hypothetical protein